MSNGYSDPQTLERLVRIETKMDFVVDSFKSQETRITALENRVPDPDHESRIRKIEKTLWTIAGAAAVAGGTAGGLISQILGGG